MFAGSKQVVGRHPPSYGEGGCSHHVEGRVTVVLSAGLLKLQPMEGGYGRWVGFWFAGF